MIKNVIFDLDGTLVDSVDLHARAWAEAFRRFGIEVSLAAVRQHIGRGGDQIIAMIVPPETPESVRSELKAWRTHHFRSVYRERIRPFPEVRELFAALRDRGVRRAIGSSAEKEDLQFLLRLTRLDDLVDVTTCGDDVDRSKPDPQTFEVALKCLGNPRPEEALVVGDSPVDAEAAHRAGVASVGLLCGGRSVHDLRSAGCRATYQDPADLLSHLDAALCPASVRAGDR